MNGHSNFRVISSVCHWISKSFRLVGEQTMKEGLASGMRIDLCAVVKFGDLLSKMSALYMGDLMDYRDNFQYL